jgi:hypothetical protein
MCPRGGSFFAPLEGLDSGVTSLVAQLFLNPEKSVVFGDTLGA